MRIMLIVEIHDTKWDIQTYFLMLLMLCPLSVDQLLIPIPNDTVNNLRVIGLICSNTTWYFF